MLLLTKKHINERLDSLLPSVRCAIINRYNLKGQRVKWLAISQD